MEAPEKIYLQDSMSTDTIGDLWPEWFDAKVSDNSIEYTRTDAFIEKTLKFLDEKFYFNNLHYCIESGVFDSEEEMFEDFKKYMEE